MIASVSKTSKIVVEKSTVPVKTAEAIEKVASSVSACEAPTTDRLLLLQPAATRHS